MKPGDAALDINGEPHVLRLTLGALAELEQKFADGGGVEALATRLAKPSVSDLIVILHTLLKGGGANIPLAVLAASDLDLPRAGKAIAAAFSRLGASDEPDASKMEAPKKPSAPQAQIPTTACRGATGSGAAS